MNTLQLSIVFLVKITKPYNFFGKLNFSKWFNLQMFNFRAD